MSKSTAGTLRVLIISDTHARDDIMIRVLKDVGSFDVLIHAGDMEGSDVLYEELTSALPGVSYYSVAGNNDFFTDSPSVLEFELPCISASGSASPRVFLTHGHRYHIDDGYREICEEAHRRGAQILICGHTHVPVAAYARDMGITVGRTGARSRHFLHLRSRRRTGSSSGDGLGDLLVLNPGSLSYPRQKGKRPSYIILEIDQNGTAQYRICYLR